MNKDKMIWELLKQGLIRVDLDKGEVYSNRRNNSIGGQLVGWKNPKGYLMICLTLDGVQKAIQIHRIILTAKVGHQLQTGNYADHINRNKIDNRGANLRLVDAHGNAQNRRSYKKEAGPNTKIDQATADAIRVDYTETCSILKTAKNFGISFPQVARIVRGEQWADDTTPTHADLKLQKKLSIKARNAEIAKPIQDYRKLHGSTYDEIAKKFSMSKQMVGVYARMNLEE